MTAPTLSSTAAPDPDAALVLRLGRAAVDFAARALQRVPLETIAALTPDLQSGAARLVAAVELSPTHPVARVGYVMAEGDRAVWLATFGPDGTPRVEH